MLTDKPYYTRSGKLTDECTSVQFLKSDGHAQISTISQVYCSLDYYEAKD